MMLGTTHISLKTLRAVLLGGVLFAATGAQAIEKKPLPDFPVTSPQGHVFSSLQLSAHRRMVLIIVSPTDPLGHRLLDTLHQWPESEWIAQTVILVEAPAAQAQLTITAEFPDNAARVSWVSDESRNAFTALNLRGLPVIIGLDQTQMQWTISGVLNDTAQLESIVKSWLKS